VSHLKENIDARESILRSIRDHLTASAPHNVIHTEKLRDLPELKQDSTQPDGYLPTRMADIQQAAPGSSLIEKFRQNLEAVGGHCVVVQSEAEAAQALNKIVSDLQKTLVRARRIGLSNSPAVERVVKNLQIEVDDVTVNPNAAALFGYDVGVSAAQAAIAETGTLVLESDAERHRLVSLVPPIHVALIQADEICLTLGEALSKVKQGRDLSPAITLITGPSRTADIELTLAIGVHGPQELYVIVNDSPPLQGIDGSGG